MFFLFVHCFFVYFDVLVTFFCSIVPKLNAYCLYFHAKTSTLYAELGFSNVGFAGSLLK